LQKTDSGIKKFYSYGLAKAKKILATTRYSIWIYDFSYCKKNPVWEAFFFIGIKKIVEKYIV